MKRCERSLIAILFCLLATAASAAPANEREAARSAPSMLTELSAEMPLRFEENVGQVKEAGVRYFTRGKGYRLFLGSEGMVFHLDGAQAAGDSVRLRLTGGAEKPVLVGIDPLPTKTNYLIGSDPRAWHTGIANFGGVRYPNVYPGTDLVFAGNDRRVEQSFFLAAGAEPQRIRMVYEGAAAVEIGKTGELLVRTPGGELTADRPVAFQMVDGERRMVECRYELVAKTEEAPAVGFALGEYDRELPLVIDPVWSNFQTPLYGSGADIGHAIGVDAAGNVYIAGSTSSTDFIGTIAPGGVQASNGGDFDGFVAKADPSGTTLLYSTYLGGNGVDEVEGIAVDAAGNAYLIGYTHSSNFPGVTAGSLQSSNAGGGDAFVVKLSPTGSAFLYATYLGGSGDEFGKSIAIDAAGNAYLTGSTESTNFPGVTAGSLQPSNAGGDADAFVAKIDAAGTGILYSTYLGGSGDDQSNHIAVDTAGSAVIAGGTCSPAFPTTPGSVEPASLGMECGVAYDAFVAKLSTLGTSLVYSTFLGGEENDIAQDLALDSAGNAYVTGFTNSETFTGVGPGSYQQEHNFGYAAFLTKINAAGSATGYSTFLGGGGSFGYGIAVDSAANAYVTGVTQSPDYPRVNEITIYPPYTGPDSSGFVTKADSAGGILYSSFLVGQNGAAYAIAVDNVQKTTFITGSRDGFAGSMDAFLARIGASAVLSIAKEADVEIINPGNRITYTLTYQNYGELDATGAVLNETVPENTVFRPTFSTPGWSCTPDDQAGSECTLALGTVAAGASGSAIFAVRVKNNLSSEGSAILNQACAEPGPPNCAFAFTPTTAAPILSITKQPLFNQARPGNVLDYRIKVFNTGNMDAEPVFITDTVPGNAVFNSTVSTPGWDCDPDGSAGSVCTFAAGNIGTGNHVTVIFAVDLSTLYSNTACAELVPVGPELADRSGSGKAFKAAVCATATTPLN